jgi:indole-3-glycerol phosphate synthase
VEIVNGYKNAGAVAVSVLTDNYFFGGSANDLIIARKNIDLPVLRKDFIIDEYQILEAKAIGADIILLIAAILTEHEIKHLAAFAKSIGLEVLLEVHSKKEIEKSENQYIDFIGVNNRNLDTFKVDINNSVELASNISNEFIKISESGITSAEEVTKLIKHGYKGFLIGENFMKSNSPENSCKNFINEIKSFAG